MTYVYLAIAIIGEITGTSLLKVSDGFERLGIGIVSLLCFGVCFYSISLSLKLGMNLSVAYAVWSGVGIVITSLLSVLIWREAMGILQILGISLILGGVVIVNVFGNAH
ncbi:DMT family transporter [Limosilactobacillus fastidiosus]|uniref:Multidrug efflux SMR transporter n=1 Tax=Limosilactobacillus fastidiosus TaxID=2759855 RepID=A0A7W3YCK6_9LACO|nr:multidrug efflux SMR transporter [Limosilactobacillus fastidiosus]MBB1086221.1 multidrug efflux SMR transporter [Limosilactobacillus fastidiosus]MCD7086506.1 multidrug efflux SMR transporter [Limosilactobacillus fastidiosus]MCD7114947.1 multidrug efflux SMR transporter [Limosilactobacillus fastidiosus]MCD7116658.1 multidrug efflux SMR transporter [Limosilactobacillus fastidiosus]